MLLKKLLLSLQFLDGPISYFAVKVYIKEQSMLPLYLHLNNVDRDSKTESVSIINL